MTTWKIHAYEPFWMPQDTFDAVMDWLRANHIADQSSGSHDVTIACDPDGTRHIEYTDGIGPARAPLVADPPDVDRPEVPYLADLQKALSEHHRAAAPSPLLVIGDTLAAEHANLQPGGAICHECSYDGTHVSLVAWPCPPARAAAERSGVVLW